MSNPAPPHGGPASGLSAPDRLDSWKEIAAYLKREVRTAQRWEKNEGLPVHRHQHDKLSSVFAYRREIDAWWQERQQVLEKDVEPGAEPAPPMGPNPEPLPEPVPPEVISAMPVPGRLRRTAVTLLVVGAFVIAVGAAYRWERLRSSGVSASTKIRLVVLPFRNLSPDPAQDVFCEGLTETMTTQLGRLDPDHLGVIASTTASLIKNKQVSQIGSDLSVNYVLEGSVLRSGDHVQVEAQLIQVSDQTHRWADTYSRQLDDMLSVQNGLAHAIAEEIRLTLTPTEQERLTSGAKVVPEAYDAYLQGLVSWNKRTPEGMLKSIGFFQQAIRQDPRFALAHAGLANCYSILSALPNAALAPREAMPKAKQEAEEAIRLDPSSAEAHAALALVHQSYDWDWQGAEEEYQRAFSINPSDGNARHWHSLLLVARGYQREALDEIERARTLDPLSPVIPSTRVMALYFGREYDRVIAEAEKALQADPDSQLLRYNYAQALVQKGRYPEAIAQFKIAQHASGGAALYTMALGRAYALSGDRAAAEKLLAELSALAARGRSTTAYLAALHTSLGHRDQAIRLLEQCYDERIDYLMYLKVEPMADPLRQDPRFQELLRRIGLI